MIILGIETSCDETALALIETRFDADGLFECRVIESLVHSQAELHSAYGGVYPSLAKREHGRNLVPLLRKLLDRAANMPEPVAYAGAPNSGRDDEAMERVVESFRSDIEPRNPELFSSFVAAEFLKRRPAIDGIAVTMGPGLEPALWTGISFARMLGRLWNISVAPVNHMEGHIVGSLLNSDAAHGSWQKLKLLASPAVALLVSGGHTELVMIETDPVRRFRYSLLGRTVDDAAGEAFDKVARLLGLPYPGGPHIAKLAAEAVREGIVPAIKLPRPMIRSGNLDFSFSGLKTAVLYAVRSNSDSGLLTDDFKKGLALEFQSAVIDVLDSKLRRAVESTGARGIVAGGGVCANRELRARLEKTAAEFGLPVYLPSRHVSGDNALMIALSAGLNGDLPGKGPIDAPFKASGNKLLG